MIDNFLDDYYRSRIGTTDIERELGISSNVFYRLLKERDLKPRGRYFKDIDTGVPELDKTLRIKYNDIVQRSRGRKGHTYINNAKSNDYITVIEWVGIVNENKELLLTMWDEYIQSGKDLKEAISIDRIDTEKPYFKENIAFEKTAFNAWKRNVRPLKVTVGDETNYFLSAEEASRFYGIRRQSIGDILRGVNLYSGKYEVVETTIKEVLENNEVNNLHDYYYKIFNKGE